MYLNREIPGIETTPAEVIAIAAELGGGDGVPRDRIVVCGYARTHLAVVMPLAMNVPACARVDRLRTAASTLARMGLTHCVLVGFARRCSARRTGSSAASTSTASPCRWPSP